MLRRFMPREKLSWTVSHPPQPSRAALPCGQPLKLLRAVKLLRANVARELVEDGIGHAGFFGTEKSASDIDVFGNHHSRRHVPSMLQLINSGTQHGAKQRFHTLKRPALRKRGVNARIEAALLVQKTGDDIAKKGRFRRQILFAFNLATDPMTFEFGKNFVQPAAGDIHLIEGLHSRE